MRKNFLLFTLLLLPIAPATQLLADDHPPLAVLEEGRALVSRTISDLSRASRLDNVSGKERERFHNAMNSLSKMDRRVSRNHYEKDDLDDAIKDTQNVVDHNTLRPEDRDALAADLGALRDYRRRQ